MKIKKRHIDALLLLMQITFWLSVVSVVTAERLPSEQSYFRAITEAVWICIIPAAFINFNWLYLAPNFLAKQAYRAYFFRLGGTLLLGALLLALHPDFQDETKQWQLKVMDETLFIIPAILTALYLLSVLYLFSMPLFLSYNWFVQQGKISELKNSQLQSELESLKNQVNPHFFFNTLNNLYSLSLNQSEKTPQLILKLSELMRYSLYRTQAPQVKLSEEIKYINNYLELQQIRLRQQADIHFTQKIIDEDFLLPPMLFINLIENAYKHGVDKLVSGAFIAIRLVQQTNHLKFSVHNNYEPAEQEANTGLGLNNLKRRLDLIYPQKHELIISDQDGIFDVDLTIWYEKN